MQQNSHSRAKKSKKNTKKQASKHEIRAVTFFPDSTATRQCR